MKKAILTAMLLIAFGVTGSAQLLNFGIKAGPNFSSFNGGDGFDYKSRTSFHAGVVLEIKPLPIFSIQPELLYTSQGADVEGVDDFNLDYVAVPIMLKFYLIPNRFSIEAGPQFSFLVDDANEAFNDAASGDTKSNSFDLAAAGGVSVYITKSLFAQARYTLGLTEPYENSDVKNAVFQLSLGYMFF